MTPNLLKGEQRMTQPKVDKPKTCKQHAYNMNTLNMTPKTNKWVEEKKEEFEAWFEKYWGTVYLETPWHPERDMVESLTKSKWKKAKHPPKYFRVKLGMWKWFESILTQTQQETLEWCEREVVGKNEDANRFIHTENRMRAVGRNRLKSSQRQTIKQRIKSLGGQND